MSWVALLLLIAGLPLLLWNFVLFVEVVAAAFRPRARNRVSADREPSYAVLIPAHDEAEVIAENLQRLQRQLTARGRILVVADNCSDETTQLARACGVDVIERVDPERRGKGFALRFGLRHLAQKPPQVVVMLDADCSFSPGSLQRLVQEAERKRRPVQCDNTMRVKGRETLPQRIALFAWRVKNGLRPRGLQCLKQPCQLTGTGMAFPWQLIGEADIPVSSIVEDVVLGLNLAVRRQFPLHLAEASVISEFPDNGAAERSQRDRWEHGHLSTIVQVLPPLLLRSLRHRNLSLAAMCLDLSVPPVSLLALATAGHGLLALGGYWLLDSAALLATGLLSSALLLAAIAIAWHLRGRDLLQPGELVRLPLYIARKLRVYAGFFRNKQVEWIRTARK